MQVDAALDGMPGAPFNSVRAEVAAVRGTESEVVVSGTATSYLLRAGTSYGTDGRWDAEPNDEASFRTRLLVERPIDPDACNGTVILVWNNVSAGQDLFLTPSQVVPLVEEGFVVVGVSAQQVGVDGFDQVPEFHGIPVEPPAGLRDWDPRRYGNLHHPGDAYSYDIFTQAAQLAREQLLSDVDVRHVIAMGASQSASRLATYVNAVQPLTSAFDAFVILVYHGFGTVLDPDERPPGGAPEMGLLPEGSHMLRNDGSTPTLVINSEFEAARFNANAQPDNEWLRWWEFAGASHGGLQAPADLRDMLAGLDGVDLGAFNYVCFLPAIRAGVHAVQHWIDDGVPPTRQPRLQKSGSPSRFPRDEHGNAVGGIRTPEVEAPLATYLGELDPGDVMNQMGRTSPFPLEKIAALYRDRGDWLSRYEVATQHLVATGVFLADDAERHVAFAADMFPGVASAV
jgi:hypothetical protein